MFSAAEQKLGISLAVWTSWPDADLTLLYTSVNFFLEEYLVITTFFAGKYSFGNILAQYELWVQNVSDTTPRIECKAQQMFMSDYQFETDKIANAPRTQGDGGYLEEV